MVSLCKKKSLQKKKNIVTCPSQRRYYQNVQLLESRCSASALGFYVDELDVQPVSSKISSILQLFSSLWA